MKRHLLVVYWLVLLVSTLGVGTIAFQLLNRERSQVLERLDDTARGHGQIIADNLDSLVSDAKAGLLDALGKLPDANLELQLRAWKQDIPHARAVVLYRPGRGLVLPAANTTERAEIEPWLHGPNGWVWGPDVVLLPQQKAAYANGRGGSNAGADRGGSAQNLSQNSANGANSNLNQLKTDRVEVRNLAKTSQGTMTISSSIVVSNSQSSMVNNVGTMVTTNQAVTLNAQGISMELSTQNIRSGVPPPVLPGANNLGFRDGTLIVTSGELVRSGADGGILNGTISTNAGTYRVDNGVLTVISANNLDLAKGGLLSQSLPATLPDAVSAALPGDAAGLNVFSIGQNSLDGGLEEPQSDWVLAGPKENSHWVAWLRPAASNLVRGVELSWEGLASKLHSAFSAFPDHLEPGEGFVLLDPAGRPFLTRFANGRMSFGRFDNPTPTATAPRPSSVPRVVLPVGDELPGWTLAVYLDPAGAFSMNFVMASTVLVAMLIISMLLGGTMLLRQARRQTTDAARKTTFVSNVSHELKTPLTSIRMYAELLGEGRTRDPAKQRSYLATIISESQRLTRLVNNVLDFSRLEQGRRKYQTTMEELGPLVEQMLETQRPRIEEAGFKLDAQLPEHGHLHVLADRDAVEQVLLNLVDNALKYAEEGHWLGVRVEQDKNQARLIVEDRGPGVPPDHRQRIFEMFHRVDDSLTARQPGCGLGLSIARRLLRDQGGDLRYEPNEPHGARFVATLPLAVASGVSAGNN